MVLRLYAASSGGAYLSKMSNWAVKNSSCYCNSFEPETLHSLSGPGMVSATLILTRTMVPSLLAFLVVEGERYELSPELN